MNLRIARRPRDTAIGIDAESIAGRAPDCESERDVDRANGIRGRGLTADERRRERGDELVGEGA